MTEAAAAPDRSAVRCEDLSRRYGEGETAVDAVDGDAADADGTDADAHDA